MTMPSHSERLAYWAESLAGPPAAPDLPADHPRPASRSGAAVSASTEVPAARVARLEALASGEGAILATAYLAAFQALLAAYAAADDVVVAAPPAAWADGGGGSGDGDASTPLVLRTSVSGDPTPRELVRRAHDTVAGAREHRLPLAEILAAAPGLALSVHFSVGDGGEDAGDADLALRLTPSAAGARVEMRGAAEMFAPATIRRMLGHFAHVLARFAAAPDAPISTLPVMGEEERRLVTHVWNRTAVEVDPELCLHELFEAQARRTPDAVALLCGEERWSYARLEARANRIAHHLRRAGAGPEVRVGLSLERGPELVAAMLAILKAGAAYVPLDPAHPPDRLGRMLADSGAAVVLTQESLRERVAAPAGVAVASLDGARDAIAAESAEAPPRTAETRNLAYVIFTSGSTGTPKGIAIAHRGVVSNVVDWTRRFGIGAGDRSILVSSLGFDISVFESLGMLGAGASVAIPGPADLRDPARWAALMRWHGVTVWNSSTALLGMLAEHLDRHPEDAPPALRLAFVGGDWIPVALADRLRAHVPGLLPVSMGGVTEVSIYSVIHPIRETDPRWRSVPWGVPMGNQRACMLDPRLRPTPVNVAGEMYLGGVGVARGYVGRPGFTAERFLPDPFAGVAGARMYRTGDRARWLGDGTIEFLGRLDAQVKIRGNRVEPGEVEAALRAHLAVERCVVVAREDAPGERRLVAYVVGDCDAAALRDHLRRALPEYMVPAAFVAMDALPLSPNGKVDRRALPAPEAVADERPFRAPRTPVEEVLAEMWTEVLPAGRVGVDDDFFELGGESVGVMRLVANLRDRLGVEIGFRAVLAHPTLEAMAAQVERLLYDDILALPDDQAAALAELNPIGG
jgi:amino acid adenylation domain-containing protein